MFTKSLLNLTIWELLSINISGGLSVLILTTYLLTIIGIGV